MPFIPIIDSFTYFCYLPDLALDTALFWGWKMIEEWNRTPARVGRSSVQAKKAATTVGCCTMLYHVVPRTRSCQTWSKSIIDFHKLWRPFAAATMAQFIQVLYWTFIRQGSHTLLDFHECRRRIPRKRSKMMSLVRRCHCSMESRDASCWQSQKDEIYWNIMKHSSVGSPVQL